MSPVEPVADPVPPEVETPRGVWARHFSDPRRERAFLSALSFNLTFLGCRTVTHAIRAQRGPFHNLSAPGGRHLHHCTFGIFGMMGVGYVWTYRWGLGNPGGKLPSRAGSRATAVVYGASAALTLDEFALWFDLEDDYWTKAGRKSIDAVALFSSLLTAGVAGRGVLTEMTLVAHRRRRRA